MRHQAPSVKAPVVESTLNQFTYDAPPDLGPVNVELANPPRAIRTLATPTTANYRHKRVVLSLDVQDLGLAPGSTGSTSHLSVPMLTRGEIHYIGFPEDIADFIPELNDAKYFRRRERTHFRSPWYKEHYLSEAERRYPGKSLNSHHPMFGKVPGDLTIERVKVEKGMSLMHHVGGVTYFHMLIVSEALQILDFYLERHPDVDSEVLAHVVLFKRFIETVTTPEAVVYGGYLGGELEYMLDPQYQCPVQLPTAAERLNLLYLRAYKKTLEPVAYLKRGVRGPNGRKVDAYDRFLIWYACKYELPKLGLRLPRVLQAEYVTKRFLWWRRARATAELLSDVPLNDDDRVMPIEKINMDFVLKVASKKFGPSFTGGI